jgi:hypothetical protein
MEVAPAFMARRYIASTSGTYSWNMDGIGWYGPWASPISITESPIRILA